ncbi:MAG: hypothetical protein SD837_00425 [Candidatus Electrothrix scaldis]|nr:MAG: hypothetical protein SD837_00425 [Candidatus Electrothrix sp. GW3-3]
MSVVCGIIKDNQVAISCDTQANCGSLILSAAHRINSTKLLKVNGSIIGIVGWSAVSDMIEHLIISNEKLFQFADRMEIFSSLLRLHKEMKENYYLETNEEDDQPVESNQLSAIIINKNGLFSTASYREVNQYRTYWAIGAGNQLALGAMHALYDKPFTAKEIAEAGVLAAVEFEESCGLPLQTEILNLTNNSMKLTWGHK